MYEDWEKVDVADILLRGGNICYPESGEDKKQLYFKIARKGVSLEASESSMFYLQSSRNNKY